ncbi:predicted protein [Lichtheimia corymbifera JMRC:FSU:9682]|uniref:Uncharacterized protein n=1 Tax=Lichtheimia corymbifera JMRC:FSU:9682 TaxID=1263082 RepID=A0A068SDM0_9FUNG|nr:predicted protein [Lichtheimia corymbifera JMRC:FSU:9682]
MVFKIRHGNNKRQRQRMMATMVNLQRRMAFSKPGFQVGYFQRASFWNLDKSISKDEWFDVKQGDGWHPQSTRSMVTWEVSEDGVQIQILL